MTPPKKTKTRPSSIYDTGTMADLLAQSLLLDGNNVEKCIAGVATCPFSFKIPPVFERTEEKRNLHIFSHPQLLYFASGFVAL